MDSESNTATAQKVEEQWTPRTVHAVFALPPLVHKPRHDAISVDLPLQNLGWTFALSLSQKSHKKSVDSKKGQWQKHKKSTPLELNEIHEWNPVTLAFHRRGRVIPWGNASMHAELSITANPPTTSNGPPHGPSLANDAPLCSNTPPCPSNNSTLLATMEKVVLTHSHSLEIKLAPCTLSLLSPSKISLALTISECPFPTGLFHVMSGNANEADAQKWLAKQCGERLLSRSFTNGTVHDVRFLASSVRTTYGSNHESLHEIHAWLSVLEGRINPSHAPLSKVWTTALAALSCQENRDGKHVVEIPCPDGHEYELDSDYDEGEAVEPVASLSPSEHVPATHQGKEPDSKTKLEGLGNPFSSSEQDGVSDATLFDPPSPRGEFIKDHQGTGSSSKPTTDCERTVVIKFAAHRTWYAFLWYCYTGHIEFCELQSQVEHGVRRLRVIGDGPPSCSPKSMYRLADLVGDKDLKTLALKAIRERMTKTNVLEETFSVFTSKYPNVRKAELDVLIEHRASSEVKKAFLEKICEPGVTAHAKPVLKAFYDRLAVMEPVASSTAIPTATFQQFL